MWQWGTSLSEYLKGNMAHMKGNMAMGMAHLNWSLKGNK